MAGRRVNGSDNLTVRSQDELTDALDGFAAFVHEAVTVEGREFNVNLSFYAHEGAEYSEPF